MDKVIKQKMKTTSIGLIPEDWDAKSLSQIGVFSKGKGITRANAQSGIIPCVRYGEIYTSHNDYIRTFYSHISPEVAATATMLKKGDVLFAGSGETKEEIGKAVAFLGDEEAYAGGDIIILSPNEGASSKYLGYVLNAATAVNQKASMGQGDAVVHIHAKELSDVVIPFPKLEEQEKIADALSGVDDMIGALDEAIVKKRQIKEGLMQQLLTGKTRLPGFSGERRSIELCSIASITIGEFVHQKKMNPDGLYPVYNGGRTFTGFYDDFNNSANKIVMSARGLAGFVNKVERPYWAGNSSYSIDVKDPNVDWVFVYYFMKYHESEFTDNQQKGGGIPAVNKNQVEEFVVQLPIELAEQHAISRALDSIDQEIELLLSKQKKCYSLKQGMMQELLTGKTRIV